MAMIDHWHPVLLSEDLRKKPVGVKLCGKEIALYRTPEGQIGALDDVCPHRRMRLSMGDVVGGKLRCKYHGWSFDACGKGESPGTPKLHACMTSFETREAYGAIWIKPREVEAEFPNLDNEGFRMMCRLKHVVKAPLETTMDNFCEIEHTSTTHDLFGYPIERMHEVQVRFESTDTTVRVINSGPPKLLPWWARRLLGIRKHYHFYDDWTTYFSPCYSVYDHWWADPNTGREGKVRWRNIHFFCPISDNETSLFTWTFAKSRHPLPAGGLRPWPVRWFLRRMMDYEIRLDVNILENLAVKDADIEGMKLSRFDKVLGLNRERIERVYRGRIANSMANVAPLNGRHELTLTQA